MTRALAIAAALAALWASGAAAQDVGVEVAEWLAGCWIDSSSSGDVVEEQWMVPRGGLMVGTVRNVRDGAATSHEFLLIRRVDDALMLTAHPSGQPSADFAAAVATPRELRFENPSHDFPQVVVYRYSSANAIVASVFATVDATRPAFSLHYERAVCRGARSPDMR